MIISVASGKGGTGKTTVSTNLAVAVAENVQLLDCDVEEPNAHLFMAPVFETTRPVGTPVPDVDLSKCTFCGKCGDLCQFKAIVVAGETLLTFEELCHSCGGCMAVCPESAITEKERELGVIEIGHRNGIAFVHGKLRVGEAMAPPLIRQVLAHADPQLTTIVDAPPGTSCPVIEAMKPADYILLVTEPTPFGLHDLKLALGAVRTLGIPAGLIINRSDLGDGRVWDFARGADLPILMEIPFDRRIAEIYSEGGLIVEKLPEWRQRFVELMDRIRRQVERDS
jgi:MinD superfamily P-loop ATPase